MEHQELIEHLSKSTCYTKREVRQMLRTLTVIIGRAIRSGRDVDVRGLGRFKNMPGEKKRRIEFLPASYLQEMVEESRMLLDEIPLEAYFGLAADLEERPERALRKQYDLKENKRHGKVRSRDRSK